MPLNSSRPVETKRWIWIFGFVRFTESSSFFVLSASPILRRAPWRALTWSGRSQPCWARWWRGWSRAPTGATPPNPTAAPAPAMRFKRRPWGGGVPADDATRRPQLLKHDPGPRVVNKTILLLPCGVTCLCLLPVVIYLPVPSRAGKDCILIVILHIHITMHTQMGHIREKYHFYLRHLMEEECRHVMYIYHELSKTLKTWLHFVYGWPLLLEHTTKSLIWYMPFLPHEHKRPSFFMRYGTTLPCRSINKYKTVKGFWFRFCIALHLE